MKAVVAFYRVFHVFGGLLLGLPLLGRKVGEGLGNLFNDSNYYWFGPCFYYQGFLPYEGNFFQRHTFWGSKLLSYCWIITPS